MWRSANVLDTNAPILLIEACIISENCSCVSHPETPVRWFTINSPAAQLAPEAQRLSCSTLRTRAALGRKQPQGGILGLQRGDANAWHRGYQTGQAAPEQSHTSIRLRELAVRRYNIEEA